MNSINAHLSWIQQSLPRTLCIAGVVGCALLTGSLHSTHSALAQATQSASSVNVELPPTAATFDKITLPATLRTKDHATTIALCNAAILEWPEETARIEQWLQHITRAHLTLKQPAQAAATAKSFFNIVSTKNNADADAVALLAEALVALNPDNPAAIAARFKFQQLQGAELPITSTTPSNTTQPASLSPADFLQKPASPPIKDNLLSTIQIDPTPYEAAAKTRDGQDYSSHLARGNLLLVADKPDEAFAEFKAAYEIAPRNKIAEATENFVRSIRAQDGCIGRANALILALRPVPSSPSNLP